jgi:predicted TIM-barrel fold metal-dependent hydrolase
MRRFDSLVHATPDGRWMSGRHDAGFRRLNDELDRAEVSRACLVGLAGVVDHDYLMECARSAPGRFVPVAGVDPGRYADVDGSDATVDAVARAGFRALKLHPRLNGYDPLDPRCIATIREAARRGLVVFLDTLFRQRGRPTAHAADVVDRLANACPDVRMVLLHSGGAALMEVAEVARLHPGLMLDLSFTLLRYAGTSLDSDIRWTMRNLDQRVVIGSDMPEYTPADAFSRAEQLAEGLPVEKWTNIAHLNLDRLFPEPSAG